MRIEIRTHQISKSSWSIEVLNTYSKKISHYCDFEFKQIKQDKDILQGLDSQDYVVVCDERGKSFSSRDFAKKMEQIRDAGQRNIVIIIGGPFGVGEKVRERAQMVLNLSSFVMNQEVALVVLFEQVFRAWTIMNNHPYHND